MIDYSRLSWILLDFAGASTKYPTLPTEGSDEEQALEEARRSDSPGETWTMRCDEFYSNVRSDS
jgi:hypothetical protein